MDFQQVKNIINDSDNIVFFGGAGTSTESGIPDFRSAGGIFETESGIKLPPEQILSHDFFMSNPKEFYRFYLSKMIYRKAKPNTAHQALAELEQKGKLKAVITQNIDGLHQMAGSKEVLELHGSVHRNYCMNCGKFFHLEDMIASKEGEIPVCDQCDGLIKPDVVLYQESLDYDLMIKAQKYISEAEVLIVAGTSLQVYPAAGLIQYYNGHKLVLINKTATPYDGIADYILQDSIGKVMQCFLD